MRFGRRILPVVLCALPGAVPMPLIEWTTRAQTRTAQNATPPAPTTVPETRPQAGVRTTRAAGVTVEKSEVVVERKQFDRRHPPPELPPLGRSAAITQSRFGCAVSAQYAVVTRAPGRGRRGVARGRYTAMARIDSVQVKLNLHVTVWVPRNARPQLVAHEEGHRVIAERIYHDAAVAAAVAEARKLIGRTTTAGGDNCEDDAIAAHAEAKEKFCDAYLDATSSWSTRVGNRYDELTSHGKRSDPGVDEAIRIAFEQEPQVTGARSASR